MTNLCQLGHILGRLLQGNEEMAQLGNHLKLLMLRNELSFLVQEEHKSSGADKNIIPQSVIEGMIQDCRFKMKSISVAFHGP